MTETGSSPAQTSAACANCGTVFRGEFCPQCGQSRKSIERSFPALAGEALGDILQWDGRFMTTYRQLFARPGRVARDYADGKRQSYTPPVRLYLVVSLVFFALITASGVRILGADIRVDGAGQPNVNVTMFQPPREAPPSPISPEDQARIIELANEAGISDRFVRVVERAMTAPEALEDQAAAAAGQAMILMVIVFALLNAALHPKRRMIEHAIHALYYHAAILLPLAGIVLFCIFAPLPQTPLAIGTLELTLRQWVLLGIAVLALGASTASAILFDRGFYGSSWLGAGLRAVPMVAGYVTASVFVSLGLMLFAAL